MMKKVFIERLNIVMDGKNPSEFGRFVKIPQQTIDRYLKGERTPNGEMLYTICSACGVSCDWILGLSDIRDPAAAPPRENNQTPLYELQMVAERRPCPECARLNATVDTLLERLKEKEGCPGRSRPARNRKSTSAPAKSSLYRGFRSTPSDPRA